jgi:hypothetical protein
MVWYSAELLNLFGAPELSELTVCGAKELPAMPDYLTVAMLNLISDVPSHPEPAVRHLDLAFLRRSHTANEEYRLGRELLVRYVEGVAEGRHLLGAYLSALTHFEQCLGAIWQAAELHDRMCKKVQGHPHGKMALYEKGQGSDLERINDLNNVAKHFNVFQAEQASTPIWITNHGIKGIGGLELSFDELYDNLTALSDVARVTNVEIPHEAVARGRDGGLR